MTARLRRGLVGAALVGTCLAPLVRSNAAPARQGSALPVRPREVVVDVRDGGGAAVRAGAADVAVTVAGDPATVEEIAVIAPGEWTVLVYVDVLAAASGEIAAAAETLAEASPVLAGLGPVTVVVADTLLDTWIEASTDGDEIGAAFAELRATGDASTPAGAQERAGRAARRRELLLEELGRRPHAAGARLLVVVGDPNAERSTGGGGRSGAGDPPAGRAALAVRVAALGWVALPLHASSGAGVAVSPLAEETGGEAILDLDALASALDRLARRRLVRFELPTLSARADVPAPSDGAIGTIVPLSIAGPPGSTVRGPRWLAAETPDFVQVARVGALVTEDDSGELEVSASASLDADAAGVPHVAVEVLTEAADDTAAERRATAVDSGRFRVTFLLARLDDPPVLVHHRGSGTAIRADGGWLLQARLDAPEELREIGVVVEDLATGRYGAALAEVDGDAGDFAPGDLAAESVDLRAARVAGPASGAAAEEPPLIRLVPPRARELRGLQTFRAMSLNAFVRRVVFYLDGRQVAEDGDDPFVARLDLGGDLRPREVRAVAFDRAGRTLGADAVTVNRPRSTFDVDIVEVEAVAAPAVAGSAPGAAAASPLVVTTRVSTPPQRRVARLELWWNEMLAATLDAPPWTATLEARPSVAGDYVRAVAYLDDGSSLEDVHLVGSAGLGEEVEVNLVEIFAVVLDEKGSPVRDLERSEVTVRLAGKEVALERFGLAEDLPLDVGLVIDTSQSMEVLMDDTRQAAVRFLADLVRSGDRAFLVDFDTKPRLAQPMTREMTDMVRALGSLRAGGNTALYDSILFSILHFEEGEDRRAIVLLTDGDDYQSRFSHRQAALQARSAGVPVYMLSLAGMDWLRPALRKADLETIAKQTGGHVFYVSAREELTAAYARISAELRSQYVFAFATPRALSEAELEKLVIDVDRRGASVRAVVAGRSIQTR